jgi:hypothetical protein
MSHVLRSYAARSLPKKIPSPATIPLVALECDGHEAPKFLGGEQMFPNRRYLRLVALLLCTALLGVVAWAQSTTEGAIGGTVADPQNAVVTNAVVTVTNTGTNQVQSVTTNSSGFFRVGQLQPGTYTVTVKAPGFAPFKVERVIVTVGSLTPVNPFLTIGASEHVEVSAEAPVINVTSAEVAQTLNEKAVQNLPINGGRWSGFAMLTPGVVSDSSGFGLVSVRGMSPLLNNVTVDGADNNQAYFSEERGRTRAGYSTPKVAIQEFQVNTSNYSSEYGRSAGGVINSVTKSGANQLHGEAYFYDRDNAWGSMNPYTTLTTATYANGQNAAPTGSETNPYKPVDVRKMGGFGVGGALVKDRLFWYFAFDRFHRDFPGTAVPSNASLFFQMPDATLPTGTTCGNVTSGTADNNVCQLSSLLANHSTSSTNMGRANTTAGYGVAYTKYVDALFGNPTTGQLGLLSTTGRVPRTGDQDILLPKLDWVINSKNHASFSVNRMRWWSPAGIQTQATNTYGNTSFGNDYVSDTWGIARFDTQISNSITNQVRFQYGRDFEWETFQTPSAYDQQTLLSPTSGYTNPYGIPPNIYMGSAYQWGSTLYGNRWMYPSEYKTQIADTIAVMHGNHSMKFGVDWVKNDDTIKNLYQQYAEFSYSGLPQYFADLYDGANYRYYSTYYQAFQGSSIDTPLKSYQFATNDFALFFQDDWKVTRRLTVNLGARFEAQTMPDPFQSLVSSVTLGSNTYKTGVLPNSPKNIGPRIGFAWDMFGDSKTVLRGGYGIYFGRIINAALYSGMTTTGAITSDDQAAYSIRSSLTSCAPQFPKILTTAPTGASCPASISLAFFDPNFKAPQIHEIDLSLQHEIGWNTTLSLSYMGSFGRHLQSFTDPNMAPAGTQYCANASGAQIAGSTIVNGACTLLPGYAGSAGTLVTPPSTLAYTLTNDLNGATITGMPLSTAYNVTMPYYTSRVNTAFGAVTDVFSGVNSSYNAFVVQLEKRFSNHLQLAANYTWSHTLDEGVNGTTNFTSGNNSIDPLNPKYGVYGNSNYNVPQRFTLNAIVEAPWKHTGFLRYLADGWQAAPVLQIQNGLGNSVGVYYPSSGIVVYDGTQQFTSPSGGMLGGGGSSQVVGTTRNGYLQPATYVADLRFSKTFPIRERFKLEFSADGFNIFNHRNVTGVSTTTAYQINNPSAPAAGTQSGSYSYPTLGPNNTATAIADGASLFNFPTSANSNFVYSTRQIQLGLRLRF